MKWTAKITCVDVTTGAEIPKETVLAENEYYVFKKTIKNIKNSLHHGTREITWHCKPTFQQPLFD